MIKLNGNIVLLHENMSTYGLNKFKNFLEPNHGDYYEISGKKELSEWIMNELEEFGFPDTAIFAVGRNHKMYIGYCQVDAAKLAKEEDDECDVCEECEYYDFEGGYCNKPTPMTTNVIEYNFNLDLFAQFDADMCLERYALMTEFDDGKWRIIE